MATKIIKHSAHRKVFSVGFQINTAEQIVKC